MGEYLKKSIFKQCIQNRFQCKWYYNETSCGPPGVTVTVTYTLDKYWSTVKRETGHMRLWNQFKFDKFNWMSDLLFQTESKLFKSSVYMYHVHNHVWSIRTSVHIHVSGKYLPYLTCEHSVITIVHGKYILTHPNSQKW